MDDDGFFQVLDRKKDMIIRSGLKVYPPRWKKVLRTHERVADAAVIGRPDPVHTEAVVAFIAPGSRRGITTCWRASCRPCAASIWRRTRCRRRSSSSIEIPRSALGKVLKKELRQLADPASAPRTPAKAGSGRVMVAVERVRAARGDRRGGADAVCEDGRAAARHARDRPGQSRLPGDAVSAHWPSERLDEVILGNVVMPADAANPARVSALWAGVPSRVPAMTVQRNCASGMEAIAEAAARIRAGQRRAMLAGGAESMSTIPLLFPSEVHRALLATGHGRERSCRRLPPSRRCGRDISARSQRWSAADRSRPAG